MCCMQRERSPWRRVMWRHVWLTAVVARSVWAETSVQVCVNQTTNIFTETGGEILLLQLILETSDLGKRWTEEEQSWKKGQHPVWNPASPFLLFLFISLLPFPSQFPSSSSVEHSPFHLSELPRLYCCSYTWMPNGCCRLHPALDTHSV